LTVDQMAALTVEQIPSINEYALAGMSAAQLGNFDVTQLTAFTSLQRNSLSTGKVALLAVEQRQALGFA